MRFDSCPRVEGSVEVSAGIWWRRSHVSDTRLPMLSGMVPVTPGRTPVSSRWRAVSVPRAVGNDPENELYPICRNARSDSAVTVDGIVPDRALPEIRSTLKARHRDV